MNVLIIRAFVKVRELPATYKPLAAKIEQVKGAQERQPAQQQRASILVSVVQEIQRLKKRPSPAPSA